MVLTIASQLLFNGSPLRAAARIAGASRSFARKAPSSLAHSANGPRNYVLHEESPVAPMLSFPYLIISRKLEILSVAAGVEQAHQFVIQSPDGQVSGTVGLCLLVCVGELE